MAEQTATRLDGFGHFEGWAVCVPGLEKDGWTDVHEVKLHEPGSQVALGYRLVGTPPDGRSRGFRDQAEVLTELGERVRQI